MPNDGPRSGSIVWAMCCEKLYEVVFNSLTINIRPIYRQGKLFPRRWTCLPGADDIPVRVRLSSCLAVLELQLQSTRLIRLDSNYPSFVFTLFSLQFPLSIFHFPLSETEQAEPYQSPTSYKAEVAASLITPRHQPVNGGPGRPHAPIQ